MSAKTLVSMLVALPLLLAQMSSAQAIQEPPGVSERAAASSVEDEIRTFARAAVSASDLAKMVEKKLARAVIVDLSFDGQGELPLFHIKACRDGKIWDIVVNALTRQIVRSDIEMSTSGLDAEDRSKIDDFRRSGLKLSEAILIAEEVGAGQAISAGVHRADGKLVVLVVVVSNGELKEISVEPERRKRGRPLQMKRRGALNQSSSTVQP